MQNEVQVQTKEQQIQSLDTIPEHLKERVLQTKNKLIIGDLTTISNFGDEISNEAAKFSNTLNSVVKIGEIDEISAKMNEMLKITKSFEPQKILGQKSGFLANLFGKAINPIEDFKNQRLTVTEGIDKISQGLSQNKENMTQGILRLEQQYNENQKNIETFNVLIGAGVLKVKDVQDEVKSLEDALKADVNNQELVSKYRNLQHFANQLDIRIHNLIMARSLSLLQSEQIKNDQNNKVMTIENINTMITIAVPSFAQQTAIYAEQLETKKANDMNLAIKNVVNDTITQNAKLMYENGVAIAQMANSSVIEASTIETAQNYLIKTIEDTMRITVEAKAKREETNKLILAKEKELRLTLTK